MSRRQSEIAVDYDHDIMAVMVSCGRLNRPVTATMRRRWRRRRRGELWAGALELEFGAPLAAIMMLIIIIIFIIAITIMYVSLEPQLSSAVS